MPRQLPRALSKSRYLAGLQCEKRLWVAIHQPDWIPPVDPATRALFEQGHEVGELATRLFPGGLALARASRHWKAVLAATDKALPQRRPLFEAAFRSGRAACRVDILDPVNSTAWDLYEVKSSTGLKEEHLDDIALQAWVLRGAGLDLRRCHLTHIHRDYVRQGELDPAALFAHVDVTAAVGERLAAIEPALAQLYASLEAAVVPEVAIGRHCSQPHACPLQPRCWSFLPREHVLTLRSGRDKGFQLLDRQVLEVAAIPDDVPLSPQQAIQVATARSRQAHVDLPAIRRFLGSLEHPLHYFDIETIAPAIPRFEGTRPYQAVPFQFSLHEVARPGAAPVHHAFLAAGRDDPRPRFLARLRKAVGPRGSLVAYHADFERRALGECAAAFTAHREWLEGLLPRFVDLLTPFRGLAYYHPDQLGSASLKAVLPALTGSGYEDLAIADGQSASREFARVTYGRVAAAERRSVRRQLEAYCARDTLSMIEIVDRLTELAA